MKGRKRGQCGLAYSVLAQFGRRKASASAFHHPKITPKPLACRADEPTVLTMSKRDYFGFRFVAIAAVMCKPCVVFSLVPLILALIHCSCTRELEIASASRLVVERSNQEAMRLYQVQPFTEEHGQWRSEGRRQIWEALTSVRGRDLTAKVIFDEKGSVESVHVQMLAHPDPTAITNLFPPPGPVRPPGRRSGIPEATPK